MPPMWYPGQWFIRVSASTAAMWNQGQWFIRVSAVLTVGDLHHLQQYGIQVNSHWWEAADTESSSLYHCLLAENSGHWRSMTNTSYPVHCVLVGTTSWMFINRKIIQFTFSQLSLFTCFISSLFSSVLKRPNQNKF